MRYRLLEILCCPECNGDLVLEAFRTDSGRGLDYEPNGVSCRRFCGLNGTAATSATAKQCAACYGIEIVEGRLLCSCGKTYPIIGGVPRLLPDVLLAQCLHRYHADFMDKYADKFLQIPPPQERTDRKSATMHAFGYQWTTFVQNFEYVRSIFLSFVQPFLQPEDFKNKLVLDVGCGSGRPASVASSFGAEIVAVDLSEAVQTAHVQSEQHRRLHVVQGDAYALPLRRCFDFVYSVGVIQHLPDPAMAIRSIANVVPANRDLVVWVYGRRELWYQPIEWLRRLTVRMPHRLLHGLSIILAALSEALLLVPYRILSRFNVTRRLAEKIPGHIYAGFPFKENVLGWFDRLAAPVTHYLGKEEIALMLRDAGFSRIEIVPRPGASASWIAKATRIDDTHV
jgi:uncharacterized protein YbaR (Trm112 family)/2-polyprenyl-3-methyl-5-hydroxy-6-metoxy-1,4-benzoquinol methylase